MGGVDITETGTGRFDVAGDLTFTSIDKKTVKSFDFLESAKTVVLDFSRVSCTDSAGLALLLEWI
ncbi:MAG: STAS domain-containing protein, partial [Gammaproteobacteria bacterium]